MRDPVHNEIVLTKEFPFITVLGMPILDTEGFRTHITRVFQQKYSNTEGNENLNTDSIRKSNTMPVMKNPFQ